MFEVRCSKSVRVAWGWLRTSAYRELVFNMKLEVSCKKGITIRKISYAELRPDSYRDYRDAREYESSRITIPLPFYGMRENGGSARMQIQIVVR